LRPFLNKLFHEARRSIWLTMAYFAPHDDLIEELCAAARRGVRVRLMLPGRGDVAALMVAARSFYETLMTAGVEVYERQGVILHAKTMVIDGMIGMIGSTNLDYRSIEYNLELSALVRSAAFGRQVEALFENDVRFAKRMSLGSWRRRPTWDRVVQWMVSRARYLL
jgi:cardiolipin synthase